MKKTVTKTKTIKKQITDTKKKVYRQDIADAVQKMAKDSDLSVLLGIVGPNKEGKNKGQEGVTGLFMNIDQRQLLNLICHILIDAEIPIKMAAMMLMTVNDSDEAKGRESMLTTKLKR